MIEWRKSSRSQHEVNTECVELSINVADTTLIRDSKDPDGPRLAVTRRELVGLVGRIKSGELDL